MRKTLKKTHTESGKPAPRKPLPGTFDSLSACSGATGIPVAVLKKAKRSGCPAFENTRVAFVPLLTWLFQKAGDETVDWPAKFREFQARREELKYEREAEALIAVTDVREMDAAAVTAWSLARVRLEQEWPPRLANKSIPECRSALREMTADVGAVLEGIRG